MVQIAQELGVSDYSLYKWRKQARASGALAFLGNGKVALTAEQQENVRLKKELEGVDAVPSILPRAFSRRRDKMIAPVTPEARRSEP